MFIFQSRADLHYYAVPVLLVCVFAYLIGSSFLSTYEVGIYPPISTGRLEKFSPNPDQTNGGEKHSHSVCRPLDWESKNC